MGHWLNLQYRYFRAPVIDPVAVRTFLDERLGPDPRHNERSYVDQSFFLWCLGFDDLAAVADCIAGFDDIEVSRIVTGGRQGQCRRFELMLMAAMGVSYVDRHPWRTPLWARRQRHILRKLAKAGIAVGGRGPPGPRVVAEADDP